MVVFDGSSSTNASQFGSKWQQLLQLCLHCTLFECGGSIAGSSSVDLLNLYL